MNIKDLNFNIALIHYPIKDKKNDVVATAVTNMDVHDLARLSATFGVKKYYVVTPVLEQQSLVNRITEHWRNSSRNDKRSEALSYVRVSGSLEDSVNDIKKETDKEVKVIATSARKFARTISFDDFAQALDPKYSYLLIFGTGWGFTDEIMEKSDYILESLSYDTGYNHLPVRSAVSIVLDRLYNSFRRLK
ncbi:MAG: RNA methyltransferase [bacterium]